MNARAREESICTRTLNSNTKYVIAFALAILVHRTGRYLHTSKERLLGVSSKYLDIKSLNPWSWAQ
jgi:hypothetical protein